MAFKKVRLNDVTLKPMVKASLRDVTVIITGDGCDGGWDAACDMGCEIGWAMGEEPAWGVGCSGDCK